MIKVHFTDGKSVEVPNGRFTDISISKANLSQEVLTGNDMLSIRDGESRYSGKVVAEFRLGLVTGYTVVPEPEEEKSEEE